MAQLSKTLSAFVWSFLEQGGSTLISIVIQIVLARLLMPEAFGTLAILLVVIEVANTIAQSGLGLALVQRPKADAVAFSSAFWLSMGLSLVLYGVIFLGAPLLASFYCMPDLALYVRVLGLVVFSNAFNSIQRAYLQKELEFKALFVVNTSAVFVSGLCGIIAAFLGWGVWALILQVGLQSLCACAVLMIVVPWKPRLIFNANVAKDLFAYGGKLCLTGILNVIYTGVSELIIGKACNPTQLGYYSQGRKWPNYALSVVSGALQNVMFPAFAKMKDDPESLHSAMRRMVIVGTYLIMPASVLLAIIAEPLIALLLTERWLPSVLVFQLICLANSILMLQLVNLRAYMAVGDSGLYLKLQLLKVTIGTLALSAAALLTHDIYVVALSTMLFSWVAIIGIDMQPAKRVLGFGRLEQLWLIVPCALLTLLAACCTVPIAFINQPYLLQLVLQVVMFAFVYIAGSCLVKAEGLSLCLDIVKELLGHKASVD